MPAPSQGSSFHSSGISTKFSAAISEAVIMISVALAPSSTSGRTTAMAESMSGNRNQAAVSWRPIGTVSNTASAMNASVPSEPTSRRRKISSGVSASRNAHSR